MNWRPKKVERNRTQRRERPREKPISFVRKRRRRPHVGIRWQSTQMLVTKEYCPDAAAVVVWRRFRRLTNPNNWLFENGRDTESSSLLLEALWWWPAAIDGINQWCITRNLESPARHARHATKSVEVYYWYMGSSIYSSLCMYSLQKSAKLNYHSKC